MYKLNLSSEKRMPTSIITTFCLFCNVAESLLIFFEAILVTSFEGP
jgi:hypothetical protein